MARDSEDKDNRPTQNPQSQPDNPFIKFRQFADEQIGSLLQGIIGLPSAFSKGSGNARWVEFDEELRRRDELILRQEQLRQWEEAKKVNEGGGANAHQRANGSPWNEPGSGGFTNNRTQNDAGIRDVPLYSPVTVSLFAHLFKEPIQESRWYPLGSTLSPQVSPDMNHSGHFDRMKDAQILAFHDLSRNPNLRSEYSLLPYLLFSRYSPLRLQPDGFRSIYPEDGVDDDFPYVDAFEDLLLASHGRPITSPDTYMNWWTSAASYPFASCWINHLAKDKLLQKSETIEVGVSAHLAEQAKSKENFVERLQSLAVGPGKPDNGSILENVQWHLDNGYWGKARGGDFTERVPKQETQAQEKTKSDYPETEEEMYERFFGILSPLSGNSGGTIRGSLLADFGVSILKEMSKNDPERDEKWIKILNGTGFDNKSLDPDMEKKIWTELFKDVLLPALGLQSSETADRKQIEDKPNPVPTTERVVSSSTTTEHTTNEDGSVVTRVTVSKRFADGRESIITKTHHEEAINEGGITPPSESAPETKTDEKQKDTKKKGWFWN